VDNRTRRRLIFALRDGRLQPEFCTGRSLDSTARARGLCGLDQEQSRRWVSWHRWTILSMLAHAYRAVCSPLKDQRGMTTALPQRTTTGGTAYASRRNEGWSKNAG